ncbi:hypothetical protein, partial [Mycolicibacterium insubricum]|uniref:hypothetical protein n=1 Tax=Mycolicibacterium insubricum TaxID=444597 RepID=UPI0021F2889E
MGVPAVARVRRGLALVETALLLAVGSPTATAAPDAATALTAPRRRGEGEWRAARPGAGVDVPGLTGRFGEAGRHASGRSTQTRGPRDHLRTRA